MAASLSRPDPTSPASVAGAGFATARRGYNHDQVRAFLTSVAAEMSRLHERERQLEAELRAARASMSGRAELDDETVTNLLGEETLRVLQTARESASQIKVRAEETAARALREAHDEANRLRQDAEVDMARRRHDAQSESEAELALAKQQGREMVNEARAYRERVLADLERRTKLARQHIEELAHGRERLLQVFERARLVAVDVTSELQAVDGPDEFVNFSPTTGPLPLMVPGSTLDARGSGSAAAASDDAANATMTIETVEMGTVEMGTVEMGTVNVDHDAAPFADDVINDANDDAGRPGAEEFDSSDDLHDEAVLHDEIGEQVDREVVATADPPVAGNVAPGNVVSLFRDRTEAAPAASGEASEAGADRTDVDDLFARLRSEVPAGVAPDAAEQADGGEIAVASSTPFTRRDEALVPLILTAARKLKRVLADEQNGVLDTLRRREPVTRIADVMPDAADHVAIYAGALADELVGAAAAGAVELGSRDTKTLRRTLEKVGALDAARMLVQTDLVGPLRERVERSIIDGGGDNDDITRRVRAVYREWKMQRIDDHLDDVFRFAFGGGIAVTVARSTPMRWTIDASEPACADCEDNSLAGDVPAGEAFPTGDLMAPAHPGCRCLTLPAPQ